MDRIFDAFLRKQFEEAMALAANSDLLELHAVAGDPPHHYLAHFCCKGLVRQPDGSIVESAEFLVGVHFPDDYLRRVNPAQVVMWMGPKEVYHPNISDRGPFICLGRMTPGSSLVDILYQVFEIITYTKVTMREDDALNHGAAAWARQHQSLFPVDRRPLKRRKLDFDVSAIEVNQ